MTDFAIFVLELLLFITIIFITFIKFLSGRFSTKRVLLFLPLFFLLVFLCLWSSKEKNIYQFPIAIITYLYSLITLSFTVNCIKWKIKIYIIILFQSISFVLSSFTSLITKFFIQNDQVNNIIDIIINLSIIICLIIIKKNQLSEKLINLLSFTNKGIKIYIVILLYCLSFTSIIISYIPQRSSFNIWYLLIFVFGAVLIVSTILLPLLISNNFSKNYYIRINQIEYKQIKTQTKYYKKLLEKSVELRRFKHDYKNQLIVLQTYLDKNNIASAKEYIKNSSEYINSLEGYKTGNYILDALLDEKSKKSYLYNTIIKCSGNFVQYSLDDIDLCIIFGNAIDNAIEACEKIHTTEPKIISIIIKQQNHILNVLITNPVSEPPIIEDNMIVTIKSDKENHGFGLYSIKRTIQKYKGLCEISCKDNIFLINITLSI